MTDFRSSTNSGKTALLILLSILLVAVVGGTGWYLIGNHSSPKQKTTIAAATATPSPRPTATPAPPASGAGWSAVGPGWATATAIDPNAQAYVYVCGSSTNGQIPIGVSQDSGRTFKTVGTPISAGICQISVDPTDSQDVLLTTNVSTQGPQNGYPNFQLWRSLNGGISFQQQIIQGAEPDLYFGEAMAWQGSTAYVAVLGQRLAVSSNKGPFTLVSTPSNVVHMSALENAIIINAECQMPCTGSSLSMDNGKHWSSVTWTGCPSPPPNSNIPIFNVIGASFDGKSLTRQLTGVR